MNTLDKIKVLGAAASYDTVCGSPRAMNRSSSLFDSVKSCIYKSRSENYNCNLFKVLMSNRCSYDCKYCINSSCSQRKLAEFEPKELADTFLELNKRGLVDGLFLSSGIAGDPDRTTESMLEAVRLIRQDFHGYVHFKVLPGTSYEHIRQASELSNRLSINIEAPNKERLSAFTGIKDFRLDILRRQAWIKRMHPSSGQTTQLIVGATDETDWEILKMVDWEHKNFELDRFYFSAFSPVRHTPLADRKPAPLIREHRLYNVEFLLRKYRFRLDDFRQIMTKHEMLPAADPKTAMADATIDRPVDINEAGYEELLHVPGIGPLTAERIIRAREHGRIRKYEQLHKLGTTVKRAKPYIKVDGKFQSRLTGF